MKRFIIWLSVILALIFGAQMLYGIHYANRRVNELEANVSELHKAMEAREKLYDDELEHLYESIQSLKDTVDEMVMLSYDYDYTVRVVAAESRGEPIDGQKAVAQTILERSLEWGMTPEQVVKAPGQYTNPVAVNSVPEDTWKACSDVLLHGERVYEEPIKWFQNPSISRSATHASKELAGVIGNHAFYY